jgi:uncharacterized membrane protein
MHFAYPVPWWLGVAIAAAVAALAFLEYRRPLAPLTRLQRVALVACRATTLAAIVLLLCRPIVVLPPASARDAIVPVVIDVSRSMRLHDTDGPGGQSRIARASALVRTELLPALSREYTAELYTAGERLAPADVNRLGADARQTDLTGALAAVRERYRGRRVAGIIVVSDGGDTGQASGVPAALSAASGPPVFAVGIGSADGVRDREVLGLTAGDPRLDQSSIDLHVSAVSSGFGRAPFQLRVLANGRVVETRRIVPPADGSPIDETFTVSPDPLSPTVYTAEVPADESEPVAENNTRSVLVSPVGRKRRVLVLEGAPGFEHSFMKRALARDASLEVDSVVRKGKNADGRDTFFVQAGAGRAAALMTGFPARREDLYAYDALVIANVEGDFFTRAQLATAADFVGERGGGLLVLGGRSFASRGLIGTPLEESLPVELSDRRGAVVRTSLGGRDAATHNKLVVTPEGENHPVMRIGGSREDSLKAWSALPALAASAPLGGPRPGATVLAVTEAPGGIVYPVVAVQRFGQGRSLIFAGEASWRWKMLLASADRTHEFFWRQAARWLARPTPDPVAIGVPDGAEPGDVVAVDIDARDAAFAPVADAVVEATLTTPGEPGGGGEGQPLKLRRADAVSGRFTAAVRPDQAGLYRVRAEARRGSAVLGTADRWFLVGGADREFADPRLNEGFLRRLARASGGRYVRASEAGRIGSWLRTAAPQNAAPEQRDLWHTPWTLAFIVAVLSAEWVLRRRWGLR